MNKVIFSLLFLSFIVGIFIWSKKDRKYKSSETVASSYDDWTEYGLLEQLWGDHVHLGFYEKGSSGKDFRQAKIDFVHELIEWSGLSKLPKGSRVLDVGCGIGGSARILADHYGFDVVGISISAVQIRRANQLTLKNSLCRFHVMDALDLEFENGSFDAVWSVEAGPHMPDKQRYADEMLRVLRPGGVLAVADWNKCNKKKSDLNFFQRYVMHQLLVQWSHPEFSSINSFKENLLDSPFSGGIVETDDWTEYTLPSWVESILEGIRRPMIFIRLGPLSFLKGFREIPTILLMRWAFSKGLMQFGVFRCRG